MSTMEGYESTLADVVGNSSQLLSLWHSQKLGSNPSQAVKQSTQRMLLGLWSRFWGRSLKQDQAKWRASQLPVNVDDTDAFDGCFVLELPSSDIDSKVRKIWVRKDYVRIYEAIEHWMDNNPGEVAPSAVVTGQAGIGKSAWLYYALCRRLGEAKPLLWYLHASGLFLFVKEGVFKLPADFYCTDFRVLVWTMIDTDSSELDGPSTSVPAELVWHASMLAVIYITSPQSSRWRRLRKTTCPAIFLMEAWTKKETSQLVSINDTLSPSLTERIYDAFGPIPRLWEQLQDEHKRIRYEHELADAIASLRSLELERHIADTSSLTMSEISSMLFLLTRRDPMQPQSIAVIVPLSACVRSRFVDHLRRNWTKEDMLSVYKRFSRVPGVRDIVALVFQAFSQRLLMQERTVLDVTSMVLSKDVMQREKWFDCQSVVQQSIRLEIHLIKSIDLDDSTEKLAIEDGVFYRLHKKSKAMQATFESGSFIVQDGCLYVFHFPMSEICPINPALMAFIQACEGAPAVQSWRFVFVVPSDGEFESGPGRSSERCLGLPPQLDGLSVFYFVVSVE